MGDMNKGTSEPQTCIQCSGTFTYKRSPAPNQTPVFCSWACRESARRGGLF